MNKRILFVDRYRLEDFFSKTVSMLKFTWKKSLVLGLIVFVPISMLYASFLLKFIGKFLESYTDPLLETDVFVLYDSLVESLFFWELLFFLFALCAHTFLWACIVHMSFRTAEGKPARLMESVMVIVNNSIGKLILQSLLYYLILFGIVLAYFSLAFILPPVFGILLLPFLVAVIVRYLVNWAFRIEVMVYEDLRPVESLKKSAYLVKNTFFRVFGISVLVWLVLFFAVFIVTGPFMSLLGLPDAARIMEAVLRKEGDAKSLLAELSRDSAFMYVRLVLNLLLPAVLVHIVYPVFSSLFYYDLKVRKAEIYPEDYSAVASDGQVYSPPREGGDGE